ncbi:MAG: helix-turn-helix domain-containing protein [Bacteroidales bacterium]|nr:helix-turn-helix domain-containing protein [Bacteroidales bacterium]
MNRRLLLFLQAQNITQSQFADTLSVARGSVSHILSGRNKPGYEFLESLALHYPTLNMDWLFTGKGSMYKDASTQDNMPQELTGSLYSVSQAPEIDHIMVFFKDNTYKIYTAEQ